MSKEIPNSGASCICDFCNWLIYVLFWLATSCVVILLLSCRPDGSAADNPESRIAEGWAEFRMGEYKRSARIFEDVAQAKTVDKDVRLSALYGLACVHWQKLPSADKTLARSIFGEIINAAPESEYAAWSGLALVRMDHILPIGETPDYPAIRRRYEALYEKFPETMPGHEAFIYMAGTYIATMERAEVEKALDLLDKFINRHPASPFISSAWHLRAKAAEALARPGEMLDAQIRSLDTVELDPSNPRMENSTRYWSIATTAEFEAGNFEEAAKYYQRLIDEYPQDRRRFATIQALARMKSLSAQFEREEAGR